MFQIGLITSLLQKLKILFRVHILLVILKAKKLLERFYKKDLQKTNEKELRVEKVIKKVLNYILNGKATIIFLTIGLIKKTQYK